MKTVGIVTQTDVRNFYKVQLDDIFENKIKFIEYPFGEYQAKDIDKGLDAILFSNHMQFQLMERYIGKHTKPIIIDLTLTKEAYEKISILTDVKEALYVNLNQTTTIDSILLMQNLGINHISFIPYYPGVKNVPKTKIAITNGESALVPKNVSKIIDLGHRVVDKSTVVELSIIIGEETYLESKKIKEYFSSIVTPRAGIETLLDKSNFIDKQLNELVKFLNKGVLFADKYGNIIRSNGLAKEFIGIEEKNIVGNSMWEIFHFDEIKEIFKNKIDVKNKLVILKDNKYLSLSINHILAESGELLGAIIVLDNFHQIEERQNNLKKQIFFSGYGTNYSIKNLIGISHAIERLRKNIKKVAMTDASVLIIGETGTGKEMVAQSIHELSNRNKQNFVAINCAAIPENLLESELFGYEGGAFTGARKEGRVGKFELANKGTLFLDEIGDVPLYLQGRLLRAIQEKEIIKIGGNKVIELDIRIIAATNIKLSEMVKKGEFREDLYFRLNVLPIFLEPLRERQEDIFELISYYKKVFRYEYGICKEAQDFLYNYNWPGNVREIKNCVEYFGSLFKDVIELSDLPQYMFNMSNTNIENAIKIDIDMLDEEILVLEILYKAFVEKRKIGRDKICNLLYEKGYFFTDWEIRMIVEELEKKGLVNIYVGRGGTRISKEGIIYLQEKKKN